MHSPPRWAKETWISLKRCGELESFHAVGSYRPDPAFAEALKVLVGVQTKFLNVLSAPLVYDLLGEELEREFKGGLGVLSVSTRGRLRDATMLGGGLTHLEVGSGKFSLKVVAGLTKLESIVLRSTQVEEVNEAMPLLLANNGGLKRVFLMGIGVTEDAFIIPLSCLKREGEGGGEGGGERPSFSTLSCSSSFSSSFSCSSTPALGGLVTMEERNRAHLHFSHLEELHLENCGKFLYSRFAKWLLSEWVPPPPPSFSSSSSTSSSTFSDSRSVSWGERGEVESLFSPEGKKYLSIQNVNVEYSYYQVFFLFFF